MITYSIVSRLRSTEHKGDRESRKSQISNEEIWHRALTGNPFKIGSKVSIRGTKLKGVVVNICRHMEDVQWQGRRPLFLDVKVEGKTNEMYICHPIQLRKRRN